MSFATESVVKAVRKRHLCDGCGQRLEIGESAIRWAGMTDGDFGTAIYHPDCRQAEIKLNELVGYQYGDDWWSLSDIEREDRPWLTEAFPTVAVRMGLLPSSGSQSPMGERLRAAISSTAEPLIPPPTNGEGA